MHKAPFIVCVTGGTASGKTSFARDIKAAFSEAEVTMLSQDNYYLQLDQVPVDSNGVQNYDDPASINQHSFAEHIKSLKKGDTVQWQEYTFNKPGAIAQSLTLQPTPLIIVEGIFALHFEEVNSLFDLKLYIDADPELRLSRRIKRDCEERALMLDDVMYRWNNHILPVFEQNHTRYKAHADMIITNNTDYKLGLNIITVFLRELLRDG